MVDKLGHRHTVLLAMACVWLVASQIAFYRQTLPNNAPATRGDIWAAAPELLLSNIDPLEESEQSGWRYFPQRLPPIAVAIAILTTALATGRFILRCLRLTTLSRGERLFFALAVGLSAVSLLTLGFGLAGWLHRWLFGLAGGIAVILEVALRCRRSGAVGDDAPPATTSLEAAEPRSQRRYFTGDPLKYTVLAACLPFLLAMILGALLPPTDFDVREYHLQGPKEFYLDGRVHFLPHNVYTSFPFLTEMLSLCAMVVCDDWFVGALAGKCVLCAFAPLTALGLYCLADRCYGERAAWLAVLIWLSTPWTYRISIIAYAEGGLACYLLAALFAAVLTMRAEQTHRDRPRLAILTGLLAGSAIACKYPGMVSVVIPIGLGLLIHGMSSTTLSTGGSHPAVKQSLRDAFRPAAWLILLYAVGTAVTFGPWAVKNLNEAGNPVYPLLYSVFGGADWSPELNAKWRAGHSPPDFGNMPPAAPAIDLWQRLLDMVLRNDWQTPLVIGLVPLCLLAGRSRRATAGLAVFALWLFATWWGLTHRIDRFWVPMLPVLCLLAAVGARWTERLPPRPARGWNLLCGLVIAAAVVFNLAFVTSAFSGNNAYLMDLEVARKQAAKPTMAVLNASLPEDARVLLVGEAEVFDAEFDLVYNTVFDESLLEQWLSDANGELRPPDEIAAELSSRGMTHIFVNWWEILRYRSSYGYTDFVSPGRFDSLVELGVIEEIPWLDASIPLENLPPSYRQVLDGWGGQLRERRGNREFVQLYSLYRVNDSR